MKLSFTDKMIERYGYRKVSQSKHGVYYEKFELSGYTHVICIVYKVSGGHLIQSYDKNVRETKEGYHMNEVCGIESGLSFWLWLKAKEMKRKYKW